MLREKERAPGAQHSRHLSQGKARILNGAKDKGGYHRVHAVVIEWKVFGGRFQN